MTQEEISEVLLMCYSDHYQVSLQLKTLDEEGKYSPDIVDWIKGWTGSQIIVGGRIVDLDEINHASIIKDVDNY